MHNTRHYISSTATAVTPGRRTKTYTTTFMTSSSMTGMVSSRVRQGKATWTTATVKGAPRKAAEAATRRIAPEGTSRSQLQRTTSHNSKSHPTLQPTPTSDTKSSHQASPAVIHQAPGKAPSLHARTARALNTPPSGAPLLSATNPTAASRSRTLQSAKLTMCASMNSTNRMTRKHR